MMTSEGGSIGIRIDDFTARDYRPGWCSSSPMEMHGELSDNSKHKPFLVRHWSTVAKFLSLALLIIVWSLVFLLLDREYRPIGYYMVVLVTAVTFFETMSTIHKVFCGVERKDTRLHRMWDFLLSVNTWKKLLMYVILSIPAFLRPKDSPLTLVCGILINLIGIIDFIHLFRDKNERNPIRYQQLGIF